MSRNFMEQSTSRFAPLAAGPLLLLLGVSGDLLFYDVEPGLNVALWAAALALAWVELRRAQALPLLADERRLLWLVAALGLGWLWRENPMLRLLDLLGIGVGFGLLALVARPLPVRLTPVAVVRGGLALGGRMVAGFLPALVEPGRVKRPGRMQHAGAVARGALVAVPALLIFGALLGSADQRFGHMMAAMVHVDLEALAQHTLVVLGCAWVAAALVLGTRQAEAPVMAAAEGEAGRAFGGIEVGMALGPLCLLFLAFVGFQVSYLFGGQAYVAQAQGVTLAEYARHGFFELCMVAGLGLPFLLGLESRVAPAGRGRRFYRVLGAAFVVLLLVVMASAFHRMVLYQQEFGLTADRLFATAFLGGVAVTAAWFLATALQGATVRFMRGAIAGWVVWLVALHAVNPEAVIVRANVARAEAGKPLDTEHLLRLGNDAAPALVAALPRLGAAEQDSITTGLLRRGPELPSDPRSWSLAAYRAEQSVLTITPSVGVFR